MWLLTETDLTEETHRCNTLITKVTSKTSLVNQQSQLTEHDLKLFFILTLIFLHCEDPELERA